MTIAQRTCAVHQPNFFPRLSTLAKLYAADIWVVLDDVQFSRRDYQHRARLGPVDDLARQQWMSLSVTRPNGRSTHIRDVRIVDPGICRRRVERMTRQHHGPAPYWLTVGDVVGRVVEIMGQTDRLTEVATTSTEALLRLVGWTGEVVQSSELMARSDRSERLADLTAAVGATEYICGTGGSTYLQVEAFLDRGLGVRHFSIPDSADPGVLRGAKRLSAVAALATEGPAVVAQVLDLLREHQGTARQ